MRAKIIILLLVATLALASFAMADDEQDYKDFIQKYRNNKDNATR